MYGPGIDETNGQGKFMGKLPLDTKRTLKRVGCSHSLARARNALQQARIHQVFYRRA